MGCLLRRTLAGVIAILVLATAAWGEDGQELNVTFNAGWENCYRPEHWVPLDIIVQIPKLKDALSCRLEVVGQQDSMTNMTINHDFVVTPGLPSNVPMVSKLKQDAMTFDVTIFDKDGHRRWSNQFGMGGYRYNGGKSSLQAVPMNDFLIGFARGSETGFRALPSHVCLDSSPEAEDMGPGGRNGNQLSGHVRVKEKVLAMLPRDWTGYECLDLLVLYDLDWSQLNSDQACAVVAWVNNGGKLLLVLGSHPLPKEHPIAALLPFTVGNATKITVSPGQLLNWNMEAVRPQPTTNRDAKRSITSWSLAGAKHWKQLRMDDGTVFCATGLVGFGKVGVVGFSPAELVGTDSAAKFWAEVLHQFNPRCGYSSEVLSEEDDNSSNNNYNGYNGPGYSQDETASNTNSVLSHLLAIPKLRPLSIWWIIGLLSALAIVLGPLDYLVLKKIDRLPLTWATSATVIVLFSVGAYYGVEKIRGGLMQVRAVTVTDAVQGQPGACWSTTLTGIFAPASDSYRLSGLRPTEWWSAISPSRDNGNYYSRYDREDASRNIYCVQSDGGNIPTALPINIWSMQCMLAEVQGPAFPLEAKVELGEDEQVTVTLKNLTDRAIDGGFVVLHLRSNDMSTQMKLGPVPAHSTKQFTGQPERNNHVSDMGAGSLYTGESLGLPANVGGALKAQGVLPRTRTINSYLNEGAAVIVATFNDAPLSFSVENRKGNVNHIEIVRLVVPNVVPDKERGHE